MNIEKPFVENYQFIEKEHSWIDSNSSLSQKQLVGGYPINKLIKNSNEQYKQLENYGIPAGLVVLPSKINNLFIGGKPVVSIKKNILEPSKDIISIDQDNQDRLFNLINVYKNRNNSKTKKNI